MLDFLVAPTFKREESESKNQNRRIRIEESESKNQNRRIRIRRIRIGVTVWSAVEPLVIPFEVETQRFTIGKDGTIKPPNVIGNLQISRAELDGRVRELIDGQKHSIAQSAKALGVSVTTVRRVCRTLKIGIYSETNEGIVSRSSQAPYGWDIVQGRLVRNEMEWQWVQKIHELGEQGTSLNKIADFLTSADVPTKNGGRWHAKTVSQILKAWLNLY